MALERPIAGPEAAWPAVRRLAGGATEGNARLTAQTGAVLLVLLGALGVTIVALGPLLWEHLFIGTLLIGPLALKLASTGYRFVRYYSGDRSYRRVGPPPLGLRLIAPIVVLSTVIVMASGIALLFAGPSSRGTLLPIHKVSFIVCIAFTALHVLAHLPRILPSLGGDYGRTRAAIVGREELAGRDGRALSLASAITAGAVLAILAIPQFAPWLHAARLHHR
jgi:hypothetical protein